MDMYYLPLKERFSLLEKVCMPKVVSGQNILNLCTWNWVVVAKQLWALATKENSLWIKWVNIYYMKGDTAKACTIPRNST